MKWISVHADETMKKLLCIIVLILVLTACGGKPQSPPLQHTAAQYAQVEAYSRQASNNLQEAHKIITRQSEQIETLMAEHSDTMAVMIDENAALKTALAVRDNEEYLYKNAVRDNETVNYQVRWRAYGWQLLIAGIAVVLLFCSVVIVLYMRIEKLTRALIAATGSAPKKGSTFRFGDANEQTNTTT